MRFIVLALALCFALSPATAFAAKKPAKVKGNQFKGHKIKPKKVKTHPHGN